MAECDCSAATDGKWAGIHEPGCASNVEYARAIRRGRHLTETEKLHNLADAMDDADREHGDTHFAATAEKIRQAAG